MGRALVFTYVCVCGLVLMLAGWSEVYTYAVIVDDHVSCVDDVRRCSTQRHSVIDVDVRSSRPTGLEVPGLRAARVPDDQVCVTAHRNASLTTTRHRFILVAATDLY